MTTTPTAPGVTLLGDAALDAAIRAWVAPRAAAVDAGRASVRDGIAHLTSLGAVDLGVLGRDTPASFLRLCQVVATVATDDLAQAFSLWAHRMAIEYLNQATVDPGLRQSHLPALLSTQILGSTSFAPATANYLAGTPLPLTFRRGDGGSLLVSGRLPWASNLQAPFLSVACAASENDPTDRVVFAYTDATPGLRLPDFPHLLALQATHSASPAFEEAIVPASHVVSTNFLGFVPRIFATFLLLQCSFCWGLATRALAEAAPSLRGPAEVLREDFDALQQSLGAAADQLTTWALASDRTQVPNAALLSLRLRFGRLAVDAVALEARLAGGRGFLAGSGTARRVREAAFLPVQAPTEVQLRWLLSRSA